MSKKPQVQPEQDASKYSDAQHVSNLVLLVARLVQQIRTLNPATGEAPVAAQAMDYLRRACLQPSILGGVTENIKRPTSPPPPRKRT